MMGVSGQSNARLPPSDICRPMPSVRELGTHCYQLGWFRRNRITHSQQKSSVAYRHIIGIMIQEIRRQTLPRLRLPLRAASTEWYEDPVHFLGSDYHLS